MALTCTIYENNLKSEVMKCNNQKLKKHSIQHAYITTFFYFTIPETSCAYLLLHDKDIWHLELHITFNLRHLHLPDLQFPFLHWQCTKPCPPLNDILLTIRARVSLCRIIGAPNMRIISKRLYATSAVVFDFNGRKLLNLVKWSW